MPLRQDKMMATRIYYATDWKLSTRYGRRKVGWGNLGINHCIADLFCHRIAISKSMVKRGLENASKDM